MTSSTTFNSTTYLQSFGWTPGSSLGRPLISAPSDSDSYNSTPNSVHNASHNSSGRLTKRILVSAKNNTLGLGRKASNLNHSDLWWERAFDVSLKNLDVNKDTSSMKKEEKEVVDNTKLFADMGLGKVVGKTQFDGSAGLPGGLNGMGGAEGKGLYTWFVKGEGLGGTMVATEVLVEEVEVEMDERPRKRRRKEENTDSDSSEEDGVKSAKKATKEAKRAEKAERKKARAEKREAKATKRKEKEERRSRREERREKKEAKRKDRKTEKRSKIKPVEEAPAIQSDSGVEVSRDVTPVIIPLMVSRPGVTLEVEKKSKKDKDDKKKKDKKRKRSE